MSASELSAQREAARQRSKAAWDAMAPGWYAQRIELWEFPRPVAE